jgi:uncharacterized protein (TIGR02118 family)
MYLNLVAFNFTGADLDAEERHYLGHHVALARRFPGLRMDLAGRVTDSRESKPERFRAAIIGFDDAAAAAAAMQSEVVPALVADTQAHLADLISKSASCETIVPLDSRGSGRSCFVMAAEFGLDHAGGSLAAADDRYRSVHVAIARRLPGLRGYMIGKLDGAPEDGRHRLAVLIFDSHQALRDAYRSEQGQQLIRDENATIRNARVWRIDARAEL